MPQAKDTETAAAITRIACLFLKLSDWLGKKSITDGKR